MTSLCAAIYASTGNKEPVVEMECPILGILQKIMIFLRIFRLKTNKHLIFMPV
jgi:hypothetical protein